ncbi:MAG: hypothetical protein AB8B96_01255 [Lysobacterales bacterium]
MQVKGNAFQAAQLGIRRGMNQLNGAASTIAKNNKDSGDLPRSVLTMLESRQQVKSSAQVMKHANRTFDALINIKA